MFDVRRHLLTVAAVLAIVATGCTDSSPSGPPESPSTVSSATPPPATRDGALLRQLQGDPAVVREMIGRRNPVGRFLCGLKVLGSDADSTHIYAWLACGDFTVGPDARIRSASSVPAVLTVAGSGPDIRLRRAEFRRQAFLDVDTARMFPPRVAHRILFRGGFIRVHPSLDDLLEQARRTTSG